MNMSTEEEPCNINVPPPQDQIQHLFPLPVQSGWTTSISPTTPPHILSPNLTDSQLGVHRISSGSTHNICTLSDGTTKVWEAVYRKGSYKPSGEIKGGFGFYLKGPSDWGWETELKDASEVVFGYAVRFQQEFNFMKGGKLPGVFGGDGVQAFGCTGGRKKDRCSCFDLRLMWRSNGQGELYAYLPITDSNTRRLLTIPGSSQNPDYGISVGRGSFSFNAGTWTTVAERVKLNDLGQQNGEVEVWVDGKSVIRATGLVLRTSQSSVIQGLHFQTFFGGSTPDWASPVEQRAWFTNVSGALIR
ncbi:hypothetical protein JB92DRAFT_2800784 [Gautieria morchelliformis]|nr:hypothetical protein JB92DRAFT_2800784 [Gautieria morchelliformis]